MEINIMQESGAASKRLIDAFLEAEDKNYTKKVN